MGLIIQWRVIDLSTEYCNFSDINLLIDNDDGLFNYKLQMTKMQSKQKNEPMCKWGDMGDDKKYQRIGFDGNFKKTYCIKIFNVIN